MSGKITAGGFRVEGGLSTQYLRADGSFDEGDETIISGSWFPAVTNVTNTSSITVQDGTYTKVGNIVTCRIGFSCTVSIVDISTSVNITLPFNRSVSDTLNLGTGSFLSTSGSIYPSIGQSTAIDSSNVNFRTKVSVDEVLAGTITFQYTVEELGL